MLYGFRLVGLLIVEKYIFFLRWLLCFFLSRRNRFEKNASGNQPLATKYTY